MNEHDLSKRLHRKLTELKRAGQPVWWLKVHGHIGQRAGVPDYLICVRGRFLALETKSPEERPVPTPRQAVEIRDLTRAGADALVSNSLDEIERWLARFLDM